LNLKKTAVAAAVAALSVPAVADAAKPADAGSKGKSEQQRSAKAQKKGAPKSQRVGFSLSGTGLVGQPGQTALSFPLTLDLVSANKHARTALSTEAQKVDKAFIDGTGTLSLPLASGDTFDLKLEGITDGQDEGTDVTVADVVAGDTVKVIGKVVRTRTKSKGSKPAFTYGAVDIRKVVITREAPEQQPASAPAA
jgi:hypothetical protein